MKRKRHLLSSKSLEFVLCEMTEEVSERDLEGFVAVFRPVPDILSFRNKFIDAMFDGQRRKILEFQPIDLYTDDPKVPRATEKGFPQAIPISFKVTKATHVRHSWWHNVILCTRYVNELFQPASGCVIELYRNSLFGTVKLGCLRYVNINFRRNFWKTCSAKPLRICRNTAARRRKSHSRKVASRSRLH